MSYGNHMTEDIQTAPWNQEIIDIPEKQQCVYCGAVYFEDDKDIRYPTEDKNGCLNEWVCTYCLYDIE